MNGGLLDEVRFSVHTTSEADIVWLEDLVKEHALEEQYILVHEAQTAREGWVRWTGYDKIWSTMTDPDTIYLKIDDDIV